MIEWAAVVHKGHEHGHLAHRSCHSCWRVLHLHCLVCHLSLVCNAQVRFMAVRQLCRVFTDHAQCSAAVEALGALLPVLQELSPPAKAMQSLWLGLLSALAKPDDSSRRAFAEASNLMHAWNLSQAEASPRPIPLGRGPQDDFRGQLAGLEAAREAASGNAVQVWAAGCINLTDGVHRSHLRW